MAEWVLLLLGILVVVLVFGGILYFARQVDMPPPAKPIAVAIVAILAVIVLLLILFGKVLPMMGVSV